MEADRRRLRARLARRHGWAGRAQWRWALEEQHWAGMVERIADHAVRQLERRHNAY